MLTAEQNKQKQDYWNKMLDQTDHNEALTPMENIKLNIFANRLGVSFEEAVKIYNDMRLDFSDSLNIPVSTIASDLKVDGRHIDIVFSMHKQNLPRK